MPIKTELQTLPSTDMIKEDQNISQAMEQRKSYLIKRRHDLTIQALNISIEYLEVERELLEYEEEFSLL